MLSNNVVTHGDLFHCLNVNGKNMWTTYDITSLIVMDNRNIAYFLYQVFIWTVFIYKLSWCKIKYYHIVSFLKNILFIVTRS